MKITLFASLAICVLVASEAANVFKGEKEAKAVLGRKRDKRWLFTANLAEECREGCSYEEAREHGKNSQQIFDYMKTYKCSRLGCPGGYYCVNTNTRYNHINDLTVTCRRDGNWGLWGSWGSWGACSKACGTGIRFRARYRGCNNPTAVNGGRACPGASSQTSSANCLVKHCPVNGKWGSWGSWSSYGTCNKACGGGTKARTRKRTCNNPAPAHGGTACPGSSISSQNANCNTHNCPVHGGWSKFTDWSKCSVSCGIGSQSRARTCSSPKPAHGGKDCSGVGSEKRQCDTKVPCPVNGAWSKFTDWSKCSVSCAIGTQTRSRACTNPAPAHGGKQCVGAPLETRKCDTKVPCPINGAWSKFTDWSKCSVSCAVGTQSRARTCTNPAPAHGGKACAGVKSETRSCDTKVPCPVNGAWTKFTDWGKCSVSCGIGTQSRSRACTNPAPAHGGKDCDGKGMETRQCDTKVPCPINGAWSQFGDWSKCSVTCAVGTQSRARTCTNPAPAHGGKDCSGAKTETRPCDTKVPCPVNGAWTTFTDWGKCSVSCGIGAHSRSRACTNPAPAHGGKDCDGKGMETRQCDTKVPCPINGAWSKFGDWSKCSVTCAVGTQSRARTCTNPAPAHGGKDCSGATSETRPCDTKVPCPVNGAWDKFTDWGKCSVSCGIGTHSRSRTCTNPAPAHGGKDCDGKGMETQQCDTKVPCPINGAWSKFGDWSKCSVTCAVGTQSRARTCTNPAPAHGGKDCSGTMTEIRPCDTKVPCPINGAWTKFTDWGKCSVSCGVGTHSRSRTCTNPAPAHGGKDCDGQKTEVKNCDTTVPCPINGAWNKFSDWSKCSVTCSTGVQSRTRSCSNPAPAHGGNDCDGTASERRQCDTKVPCPVNGDWTKFTDWGKCSVSCGIGTHSRSRTCTNPAPAHGGKDCIGEAMETQSCDTTVPCPINGAWTQFLDWSKCSVTCGVGSQSRSRTCNNPAPAHGGKDCLGTASEKRQCDTKVPCPVNGAWTKFTAWGKCSVLCGNGTHSRSRTCSNPAPAHGGKDCVGKSTETRNCDTGVPCPIDGAWSPYRAWGKCSVTCGVGSQSRVRTCTNPAPAHGGKDCTGTATEQRQCDTNVPCPVNGAWTKFSDWGKCSVSCGTGTQSRSRSCTNPAPAHGGNDCDGDTTETKKCDTNVPCPINGAWSKFSDWGKCSVSCGTGTHSRSRTCTNPAPAHGGKDCVGQATEAQTCDTTIPCPINGDWGKWQDWTRCSVTCGDGTQSRTRKCDNPAPQHGGKDCIGINMESQACNIKSCPTPAPTPAPTAAPTPAQTPAPSGGSSGNSGSSGSQPTEGDNSASCAVGQYGCHNSTKCIETDQKCDGKVDCPNNDDEFLCALAGNGQPFNPLALMQGGVSTVRFDLVSMAAAILVAFVIKLLV